MARIRELSNGCNGDAKDEKEAEKPPPSEAHLGTRAKPHHLGRKEFELLYIEVLYTIKHKIGTTSASHLPFIQDLYLYAREAFGVTPEDHARLLARASEEKPPILILKCTVVEARNLEAKDADGFSDPYCMMGIMPGSRSVKERSEGSVSSDEEPTERRHERRSALKKFSQSFKRKREKTARDLIPARYIRTTSVKPNTLNPIWNERSRFDLDDVHTDTLHLDIWDHDDEVSVMDATKKLNEVQGLKGLGRFFKQVAQSARNSSKGNVDDFLGSVNIKLHDIPSTGVDRWYDLEGRSSRSNVEGSIRLQLSLATREDRGIPEEDNWTDFQQHIDLICIFIEHEIRKFRDDVHRWSGELPQAAMTTLHQHAIQGDITEVQEAVCRWSAFSRKHQEHPYSWEVLLKLLYKLEDVWAPGSLSRDEEECLAESFHAFIEYCLSLISKQRDVYPPANRAAQKRLELLLRCLCQIYDMALFKRCCPFEKELNLELSAALRRSSQEYYEKIKDITRPQSDTDDDTISALIDRINYMNTDVQKALQYYEPLYQRLIGFSYFCVVYKQLEKVLGEDLSQEFAHLKFRVVDIDDRDVDTITAQDMGTHLFDLYLALLEFCKVKDHLPASDRRNLTVTQLYEWFRTPIQRWIKVAKFKTMSRIKKAVELDKVGSVEGDVKQSTSAVDVCCCFGQVIEFWRHLAWPDLPSALPYVTKITEDLCEGATYYADLIHEKLKVAGYYDEAGHFDVTEQLCITINDIEQVRRALKPIPEALRFNDIIEAIEKQNERSGKEARITLYSIIRCADEDTTRKIKQVIDRVADKMRPDIKKDVFHLCWAPESVPADNAICDLMNYLDSNLVTLNSNLLRTNFDRILHSIWVEVLEEMTEVLKTEEVKNIAFYERLYDALEILVDFFHANAKGLPLATIRSGQYEGLYTQLSMNRSKTPQLMEAYYIEKMDEQDRYTSQAFGTLSVRVYYNHEAEILSVEVLNARNLIPLDPNGLSDPFVLIDLCPHHVFPKSTQQQTKIVKKTLNPVFDESFEFSLTVEDCQADGACINFTVMDHDFMVSNDFAGEAFLSLNTIPGISGEEISGFFALTPLTMTLTQPRKSGEVNTRAKCALNALALRDWDREAQDFVKKRRNIEQLSQQL